MTVYSPSAYNNIKENSDIDWIFYLPHDTIKNAKKIISSVKPIKVIFVRYEFWYNYLSVSFVLQIVWVYFVEQENV